VICCQEARISLKKEAAPGEGRKGKRENETKGIAEFMRKSKFRGRCRVKATYTY